MSSVPGTHPQLFLLGEAQFIADVGPHPFPPDKPYFLLAYLAIKQDWVSREHLAELFWSGDAARRNLRKLLFKIRAFGWAQLEESVAGLRWQPITDFALFERACAQERWEEALAYYKGKLLANLDIKGSPNYAEWLELERMRLADLYEEARAGHAAELEARGNYEAALQLLQSSLQDDPLNEASYRSIMRLEHKRGNSEAVFEHFEQLRQTLKLELGVEPLEETVTFLKELEQGGASQGKSAVLLETASAVPDQAEKLLGREDLLKEAKNLLKKHQALLIHGFGGMGKTALAAELTAQHVQAGEKALWLQLGSEDPETVFEALAIAFDASQALTQSADKASFLKQLFRQQGISLLVLDDVWNAYSLSRVTEALPEGLQLLITSRQRYPKFKRLSLGRLSREAALELLSFHAARPVDQDDTADKLCQLLGDHAFALRIAGLTLKQNDSSPKALLARIENAPFDLKIPGEFAQESRQSVASLLNVSLETLTDLEYECFLTFGLLPTPAAGADFMAFCLRRPAEALEDALFGLSQRGLAERQAQAGSDLVSYRIHDLAHAYARVNRFQRSSTLISAAQQYVTKHQNHRLNLEIELPNVLGAVQAALDSGEDETFVDLMQRLSLEGGYYTARGHSSRSLELLKHSADIAQAKGWLEPAHKLLTKLGEYYLNFAGNNELALSYYERACLLAKRLGDKKRIALLLGLIGLVRFQLEESDVSAYFAEAESLANELGDKASLSRILDQKSFVAAAQNDWWQANRYLKASYEALQGMVEDQGPSPALDQNIFFVLLNLGETEFKLGHFEIGFSHRQKALELAQKSGNQLWVAMALTELGEMQDARGQRKKARDYLLQALDYFQVNQAPKEIKRIREFLVGREYFTEKDLKQRLSGPLHPQGTPKERFAL